MVHNPPLFLYLYTLSLPYLYLRIPFLLNNHFLDTLPSYSSNSFTHLLFSSSHVSSILFNHLYSIFKHIRLTSALLISLVVLLLCLSQCLDSLLYINFSLSHSTFPSSWNINCSFHQLFFPFLQLITLPNNPSSSSSSFRPISSSPPFLSKLLEYICFPQLMPLSPILISFPPVSLIFIDLTAQRWNYFTSLMSCFVISTIVALLPSLRLTS